MSIDETTREPIAQRSQGGFPIASLGLLITVFACLLVCADTARWHEQYRLLTASGPWWLAILVATAAIVGGIIGFVRAIVSRSGWRMRVMAPIAGILAGEVALFVLLAPGPVWRTIFAIAVLIGASVLFRLDAD